MEVIDNIKTFIAKRNLRKEMSEMRRVQQNISIEKAKNIGVLYSISDEETYKLIFRFLKSLKTEQRSVIALGFLNDKKFPTYLTQGVYNSIISLKDLNWFGKPVNQYVKNFFNENFDIFLNISLEDYFPLYYISALSNATFKVGKYHQQYADCFDMMIKTDENTTQQELIDNMLQYIRMINQNNNES